MTYATPLDMLQKFAKAHPEKPMLYQPVNRQWQVTSWGEALKQSRQIASGLKALGLEKGDKVAILAKNSAEWFITDWAIMMAGLISVPIYATAGEDTIRYVLSHSEAKAVFLGKLDSTEAAEEALDGSIPRIAFPYETAAADHQWGAWLERFKQIDPVYEPSLDETMSIVYTSGSTGQPKGVVLTYRNYASASESHRKTFSANGDDRLVSYLPLAHITERAVIQGPGLYGGVTFYFVESLDTFVEDLTVAKPTLFLSVPRLWTRFQLGVFAKLPARKLKLLLSIPIIGGLVARKVRRGLGIDQARIVGSGSAPISKSTLDWYQTIGVNISEGWGMSETAGLSCSNLPFNKNLVGTLGVPCSCVEMKLSDEGEILIRGEAVFKEYYKDPEATQASFTDGWFHTGDKAKLVDGGAYQIIGRVKESFKTGKGKYVAPVPIESALSANSDIEQICVMGSGRKQPVAVVVLAPHVDDSDRDALRVSLAKTLAQVNNQLESHMWLDCIVITKDGWSIENEMLTPTLKIKRSQLEARYGALVQAASGQKVIWEDEITVS